MVQVEERVRQLFGAGIEAKITAADALTPVIAKAGLRLVDCLLNDGKILVCGNGGSAANGLHFSMAMLNHFDVERPSLPVIALTCEGPSFVSTASHNHHEHIFARQIHALGAEGDVLLTLSTSGDANSLLHAIKAASTRGMTVIALTGRDGGFFANHLQSKDLELRVHLSNSARIREIHLFILHCFCDLIEQSLFGPMLGG